MFQSFVTGVNDLLAVDIQRGRDTGVPPYNVFRELCGFPKAYQFEDFGDLLEPSVS
jgi:peroxidase